MYKIISVKSVIVFLLFCVFLVPFFSEAQERIFVGDGDKIMFDQSREEKGIFPTLNKTYKQIINKTTQTAGFFSNTFCNVKELFGGNCLEEKESTEDNKKETTSNPVVKKETPSTNTVNKNIQEVNLNTNTDTRNETRYTNNTDSFSKAETLSLIALLKQELLSIIPRETTIIERESRARNFIVNTDRALTEGTTDFSGSTITTTGNGTIGGSLNVTGNVTANAFIGDGSLLTGIDPLPTQTGNGGKYLTTDGTASSWASIPSAPTTLSDLNDVVSSATTTGYALISNGTGYVGRALLESDISDFGSYLNVASTTDDITEGLTNLYFTNARAITALTGQNNSLLTNDSGYLVSSNNLSDLNSTSTARTNLGLGSLATLSDLSSFDTDDVAEGSTNLYSQWSTSGSDVYYNGGNVGIGTSAPDNLLHVVGDDNALNVQGATFENSNSGSSARVGFNLDLAGSTKFDFVSSPSWTQLRDYTNSLRFRGSGSMIFSTNYSGGGTSDFIFYNNTTELMRIDDSGNVGIGTSTPTSKLTLGSGQVEVPVGSASTPTYSFTGDLDTGIYLDDANKIGFSTGGTLQAYISSTGVLFGNGSAGLQNWSSIKLNSGTESAPSFSFNSDTNTGMFRPTTDTLGFSTAGAERFRIDDSGNVGIGVVPTVDLDVYGGASTSLRLTNDSSIDTRLFASSSGYAGFGTQSNHDLVIRTNGTERMRVDNDGNVGIGTASPNEQLEITKNFRLPATTGSDVGVIYQDGNRFIHTYGASTNSFFGVESGNFTLTGGVNTGVGYQTLDALTSGQGNNAFGYQAGSAVTSGSWNMAMGRQSLVSLQTGSQNTAVGRNALYTVVSGSNNVGIGDQSLFTTTSSNNVGIGRNALYGQTTGANNIAVGTYAGDNLTTGSGNIIIGYNIDFASATADNQLNIGNTIYGDLSSGSVGIGTSTIPDLTRDTKLYIEGSGANASGRTNFAVKNTNATSAASFQMINSDGESIAIQSSGTSYATGAQGLVGTSNLDLIFSTNGGVSSGGSNDIIFRPGGWGSGQESVWFKPSGRVGIGTDSPSDSLEVASGNIILGTNYAYVGRNAYGSIGWDDATTGNATLNAKGDVIVNLDSNNNGTGSGFYINKDQIASLNTGSIMSVKENGRVGIGTNSPSAKLHVSNGSALSGNFTTYWTDNDVALTSDSASASGFRMVMANDTASTRMSQTIIRSRGTLSSPTAVQTNDYIGDILFGGYGTTGIGYAAGIFAFADGNGSGNTAPIRLSFVTGSHSADRTERLKIGSTGDIDFNAGQMFVDQSTGYVGIGTTTPQYKLDVAGKIGIDGSQFIYVPGGNFTGTSFIGNGGANISYTSGVDGKYNTFYGLGDAGVDLTIGSYNAGFGYNAGGNLSTGQYNMAIGVNAMYSNSTGSSNVGIGYNSLYKNTSSYNVGIGSTVLFDSTSGTRNTAIGYASMADLVTHSDNTAIGYATGILINSGASNTLIGSNAGRYITGGSTHITTANNSVFLGANTKANADSETNQIVIGYDATGAGSNSVVLGNDSITKTLLKGNVGIGTTDPQKQFHVVETSTATNDQVVSVFETTGSSQTTRIALSQYADTSVDGRLFGNQIFAGSSGAGWADYEARPLSFWTGTTAGSAARRMHIDTDGTVNIGNLTTNTGSLFNVDGNVSIGGSYSEIDAPTNGLIVEGNVGIGTSNPAHSIDVSGQSALFGSDYNSSSRTDSFRKMARFFATHYDNDDAPVTVFLSDSDGTNNLIKFGDGTSQGTPATEIQFLTASSPTAAGSSTSDPRLIIKSSGNVGVGTDSPSAKLHVLGTTEQFRLGYDSSNFWTNTVASDGDLTVRGYDSTGYSPEATYVSSFAHTSGSKIGNYFTTSYTGTVTASVYMASAATRLNLNSAVNTTITSPDAGIKAHDYSVVYNGGSSGNPVNYSGSIVGLKLGGQLNSYGNVGTHYGVYVDGLRDYSSGNRTVTTETGIYTRVGTGTVSNYYGNRVSLSNGSNNVTTTMNGFRVDDSATVNASNAYGMYVGDLSGTASNIWGLYVNSNDSYFGGNVGIGTTDPDRLVHLSSSIPTIILENTSGSANQKMGYMNFSSDGSFSIGKFSDALSATEQLTITTGGNVGIGKNPAYKLDVNGQINASSGTFPVLGFTRTTSETGGSFSAISGIASAMQLVTTSSGDMTDGFGGGIVFELADNGHTAGAAGVARIYARRDGEDSTGALQFYGGSAGNSLLMTLRGSGNVGIGTEAPSRKLHVKTTADEPPVRFEDSDGYCEINPTTTTWSCTSDVSLKDNIESLDSQEILSKVEGLRPVTFTWKSDESDGERLGLIAQEVEEIFPDLVNTDPETGLKSVSYGSFTTYLISAVQELSKKVSGLFDGVANVFVGSLKAKDQICIGDTCVTEEQLKELLNNQSANVSESDSENDGSQNDGQVVEVGDSYTENENGEIEEIDPITGENLDTEEDTIEEVEESFDDNQDETEVSESEEPTNEETIEEEVIEPQTEEVVEEEITNEIEEALVE